MENVFFMGFLGNLEFYGKFYICESFKYVSKAKKEEKHEEIEFHNSVQEFLLQFIGCRNVLEKMPV